jgi:hypothetical protein
LGLCFQQRFETAVNDSIDFFNNFFEILSGLLQLKYGLISLQRQNLHHEFLLDVALPDRILAFRDTLETLRPPGYV